MDTQKDTGMTELTRKEVLAGGAAALLAMLAGFKKAHAANKPLKVGFILPDYDQLRWKNADQAFFEKEARKIGIDPLMQVSNSSEALQTNQVENLLTQGIDVLVLTPVNPNAANALVRKAKNANVPVINYNFMIPKADVAAFIGRDAVEMGEKLGRDAIAAQPKGNYILALGDEATSVAVETGRGYRNVLKPYVDKGDIKIVSDQFNKNWSTDSARSQVENALTKNNNNIVAVLCGNDGTAYGAIQALQAQGLGGKVFVTGVDAEEHAQELILQGLLNVSNFTAFDQMGMLAADAAAALGSGQPIKSNDTVNNGAKDVPWVKVLNFNVNKENIAKAAEDYPWWFDKAKLKL